MGDAYSILMDKINTEKAICIEAKKKQFKYIFRSRKHFEPECKQQAEDKYRAELDAATKEVLERNEVLDTAFVSSVSGATQVSIVKPLIIIAIIATLFYIFFL